MKAVEFYKILDSVLREPYEKLGIRRLKGAVSRWVVERPSGQLFVEFKSNAKYPWNVYGGGTFDVWTYWTADLRKNFSEVVHDHESVKDFHKDWPDNEYEKIAGINSTILRKISALDRDFLKRELGPDADDNGVELLHASAIKIISMSIDESGKRRSVFPDHHYYDECDVKEWGELILRNTSAVLSKVYDTN